MNWKLKNVMCNVVIFTSLFLVQTVFAQCNSPEASQLDFLIGDWDLTHSTNGTGHSTFEKILNGCVVYETTTLINLPNYPVMNGISIFIYDSYLDRWEQNWVDDIGGNIFVTGNYDSVNQELVMIGEVTDQTGTFLQKLIWYDITIDTVHHIEYFSYDGGQTWLYPWEVLYTRSTTALENRSIGTKPKTTTLKSNYPNPFNPSTTINYTIKQKENVILKIYNLLGQEIKILVYGPVSPGNKTVVWDGRDNTGKLVPAGTYYYRLQTGTEVQSKKMLFLK